MTATQECLYVIIVIKWFAWYIMCMHVPSFSASQVNFTLVTKLKPTIDPIKYHYIIAEEITKLNQRIWWFMGMPGMHYWEMEEPVLVVNLYNGHLSKKVSFKFPKWDVCTLIHLAIRPRNFGPKVTPGSHCTVYQNILPPSRVIFWYIPFLTELTVTVVLYGIYIPSLFFEVRCESGIFQIVLLITNIDNEN